MEISVAVTMGMKLYALLVSVNELISKEYWILNQCEYVWTTSYFYLVCRWIQLEQSGVKFLAVTSQNQRLKWPL